MLARVSISAIQQHTAHNNSIDFRRAPKRTSARRRRGGDGAGNKRHTRDIRGCRFRRPNKNRSAHKKKRTHKNASACALVHAYLQISASLNTMRRKNGPKSETTHRVQTEKIRSHTRTHSNTCAWGAAGSVLGVCVCVCSSVHNNVVYFALALKSCAEETAKYAQKYAHRVCAMTTTMGPIMVCVVAIRSVAR